MLHQPLISTHLHKAQRGILSEVVFGNPQNGCRSMGVCKVHIGPSMLMGDKSLETSTCSCKKAIAFLRSEKPGKLLIHFLNYSLSVSKKEKYFPRDRFVVEVAFPLPGALQDALGLGESQYFIQPGHYPTQNDGLYHTIEVTVAKN